MVSHYNGQNIHLPCSKQTKMKTQYATPVVEDIITAYRQTECKLLIKRSLKSQKKTIHEIQRNNDKQRPGLWCSYGCLIHQKCTEHFANKNKL